MFLTVYSLLVPLCPLYHIWVHCRIINNPAISPPFSLFSAQKKTRAENKFYPLCLVFACILSSLFITVLDFPALLYPFFLFQHLSIKWAAQYRQPIQNVFASHYTLSRCSYLLLIVIVFSSLEQDGDSISIPVSFAR